MLVTEPLQTDPKDRQQIYWLSSLELLNINDLVVDQSASPSIQLSTCQWKTQQQQLLLLLEEPRAEVTRKAIEHLYLWACNLGCNKSVCNL